MDNNRYFAIIRLTNWVDGEAKADVKMDFFGERNAKSEWDNYIAQEDLSNGVYVLMDIQLGEIIAKVDTKDLAVQ